MYQSVFAGLPIAPATNSANGPEAYSRSPEARVEKGSASQDFSGLISRTQKTSETSSAKDKDKTQAVANQDDTQKPVESDAAVASLLLALMVQPQSEPVKLPKLANEGSAATETITPDAQGTSPVDVAGTANTAQPAASLPGNGQPVAVDNLTVKAEKGAKAEKKALDPSETKLNPAEIAGQGQAAPATVKDNAKESQHIKKEILAENIKTAETAISEGGTGVALNGQRMKLAAEKNEIAGRAVQKLQRGVRPSGSSASAEAGEGDNRSVAASNNAASQKAHDQNLADSGAGSKNDNSNTPALDTNVKVTVVEASQDKGVDKTSAIDRSAAQVERVSQLVNREVMTIRQSGATALAVSLKVDAHTELFLQLTNHNGQMQALLRCERGDVAGLNKHWTDLQDSLSKQNVHLMPLENRGAVAPAFVATPVSNTSSTFNFNQSSQNPGRQASESREEVLPQMPENAPKSNAETKTKNKTASRSRQGWESWA